MQHKTTHALFESIEKSPDVFLEKIDDEKLHSRGELLSAHLITIMKEKHLSARDLIIHTAISQSQIYQVLSGTRGTSRDNLLNISLAMKLSLEQTQRLLLVGQCGALYPQNRRDAVIISCINRSMQLTETNEALTTVNERPLI